MLSVDITSQAPESYLALAWDIFYASRGRGISRAVNMPWVDDEKCYFVTLSDGSDLVGGLAVRPVQSQAGYVAGLIGMVCVRADQRGKGLSQIALAAAYTEAGRRGIDDLVLWTAKPKVYESLGFSLNDNSGFGSVTGQVAPQRAHVPATCTAWPLPDSSTRGLPPYAVAGFCWSTPQASLVVMEDARGPILCEWRGNDADVADLLAVAMPADWRMHALGDDTLPSEMARQGWLVSLIPTPLQMTMQLRPRECRADVYKLRVLDRI